MFEYLIAFGAGLISFLSPCVLPLIPGYISFISGQSLQEILNKKKNKKIFKMTSGSQIRDYLNVDLLSKKIISISFLKKNIGNYREFRIKWIN